MAAGVLPAPGTEYGPCGDEKGAAFCSHTDCRQTREMAGTLCRICGKPIGYETAYYQEENWRRLVHARCLEATGAQE